MYTWAHRHSWLAGDPVIDRGENVSSFLSDSTAIFALSASRCKWLRHCQDSNPNHARTALVITFSHLCCPDLYYKYVFQFFVQYRKLWRKSRQIYTIGRTRLCWKTFLKLFPLWNLSDFTWQILLTQWCNQVLQVVRATPFEAFQSFTYLYSISHTSANGRVHLTQHRPCFYTQAVSHCNLQIQSQGYWEKSLFFSHSLSSWHTMSHQWLGEAPSAVQVFVESSLTKLHI